MLFLGSVLFRKNNRGLLSKETTKLAESMMWTVHSIHLPRNGYNKIFLCFKSWNHEIIWISQRPSLGVMFVPWLNFKTCCFTFWGGSHCRYCTIVFALFSVTVAVSIHLCVIFRHFCCPTLLFQGHLACPNFVLTGPQSCGPGSVLILGNYHLPLS